jgi:DNA repair exonuclease SbcCD ATPase subunit
MAETVKIAELTIEPEKLIKELQDTKKQIDSLSDTQKQLKKAGDTSSKMFVENEQKLKSLRKEYNAQGKSLQAVTGGTDKLKAELNKEIKSIKDAKDQNSALRRIRDEINVTTEEGQKALKEINARIDKNTNLTKKNTDSISKQKSNVGAYTSSINKAKVGVKGFGMAMKAAGIGLAVAAYAKLSEVMGNNKRVMLALNTVTTALSSVVSPLFNAILDGAEAAYKATGGFDAMGTVVSSLITLGLTPLKTTFYSLKLGFLEASLAFEKSFLGDKDENTIKELNSDLVETKENLKQVGKDALKAGVDIYESAGEAVGEISTAYSSLADNVGEAANKIGDKGIAGIFGEAKDIAKFRQELEQLETQQDSLTLKYQKQAEIIRQKRDDENNSVAERKAFNQELQELLKQQEEAEKSLVNQKIEGYQRILEINKNDLEAQNALTEARGEMIDIEERITGQMSEQMSNRNGLRNEETAKTKEENKKQEEAERKKLETIETLRDEFSSRDKEKQALKREEELEQYYADKEAEIERLITDKEERKELLIELENQKDEALNEVKAKQEKKEIAQRDKEVQDIVDNEKKKIKAKTETIDAVSSLFGKETAVAKGALIAKQALALKEFAIEQGLFKSKQASAAAEASVDTSKGMAKTASSVPFPANIPLIIGYIAQTAGLVSTIKSAVAPSRPQFARGGNIFGASHSGGGVPIEAEGGESIINKKSTAKYGGLLNAINQAGGGVPIMGGNQAPSGIINYDIMAAKVAQANMSLPAPRVGVDEINKTNNRVKVIENRAKF